MNKVLAGSAEDHRWRPLRPEVPQKEKSPKKVTVYNIIKQLRDENTALQHRLNAEIEKNLNPIKKPKTISKPEKPKTIPKIDTPRLEPKKPTVKKVVKKVAKKVTHKR